MQTQTSAPVRFNQVFFAEGGMVVVIVDSTDEPSRLYAGRLGGELMLKSAIRQRVNDDEYQFRSASFGTINVPVDETIDDSDFAWWCPDNETSMKLIRLDPQWFDIIHMEDKLLLSMR